MPFVDAGASKDALPVAVLILDRYLTHRNQPVPSSGFVWRLCGAALVLASKFVGRAPLHLGSLAYSMSLNESQGPEDFKVRPGPRAHDTSDHPPCRLTCWLVGWFLASALGTGAHRHP
jgi:hypothetical protein